MEEEVKLGKQEDLKRSHDITNGASGKQKMNISYNFREECKTIISLVYRHSPLYLFKFLAWIIIIVVVTCVEADSYHALIVNSFIFLGGLLFDQLGKKKIPENFDFKKAEKFCDLMAFFIFILFLTSILLLILENKYILIEGRDNFIDLCYFKWLTFLVLFSSSFSRSNN